MLKDAGDKLSAAEKQPVEAAIEALKSALDKGDATAVNARARSAHHGAAQGGRSALSPGADRWSWR